MDKRYTPGELEIIKRIARHEINSLIDLQGNPGILVERLKESKEKGFDQLSLTDYYEDLTESWMLWEHILENPQDFLKQVYPHNYEHIHYVMKESYKPSPEEMQDYKALLAALLLARNILTSIN